MTSLLSAVHAEELHATCLYPNTDRGHEGIIDAIHARAARAINGEFRVVPSLPRDEFLIAMHKADVLLGNSSSGIIEAASVGTPAINIGSRQEGRQVSGRGVIHCEESTDAIRKAIRQAAGRIPRRSGSNVYGDGRAGERIAKVLAQTPLNEELRRKLNSY